MFSEIQVRLAIKDPVESCKKVDKYVADVYSKDEDEIELTNSFSDLVEAIFGNKDSWMERSYKNETLSQCLFNFLKPEGHLFQFMMYQHDHYEGVRYRLPLDKLSLGTLTKLENGTASELYQEKLISSDIKKIKFLPVSMFEYFMFIFSEFAENSLVLHTKGSNCYVKLLQSYLNYFLKNEKLVEDKYEYYQNEDDFGYGYTMTEILCDRWLTQYKQKKDGIEFSSKFLNHSKSILYCFQIIQTHILSNDFLKDRVMKKDPNLTSGFKIFQKSLFQFFDYSFLYWPRNVSMPLNTIIQLWLNQLQPWKFHKENFKSWQFYILTNWVFYSTTFSSFLTFFSNSELLLSANSNDINSIENVLKLFTSLSEIIKTIDEYLKAQKVHQPQSHDNAAFLFSHMKEMDPKTNYKTIFDSQLLKSIGEILSLGQGICSNPKRFTKIMNLNLNEDKEMIKKIENIMISLSTFFSLNLSEYNDFNTTFTDFDVKKHDNLYNVDVIDPDTNLLSLKGKKEIILGLKKSNKFNVRYIGNPLYQPKQTIEIPYLVNFYIILSEKLNEYIGSDDINLRFLSTYSSVLMIIFKIGFSLTEVIVALKLKSREMVNILRYESTNQNGPSGDYSIRHYLQELIRGSVDSPSSEVLKIELPFQIEKNSIKLNENEIQFKFHSSKNVSIKIMKNIYIEEFEANKNILNEREEDTSEEEHYFQSGLNQEFKVKIKLNENLEEREENFLIQLKNLDFENENDEEIKSLLCFFNQSQDISYFEIRNEEFFQLQDIYGSNENEIDYSEECVVCLTNDREIALLPCRHNCICHTCFLHLDKCPICRQKIKAFVVLKPSIIKEPEEIDLEELKQLRQLKIEK
eukprot:gene9339-1426_t